MKNHVFHENHVFGVFLDTVLDIKQWFLAPFSGRFCPFLALFGMVLSWVFGKKVSFSTLLADPALRPGLESSGS